ncbi:MAG: hypothetical protein JST81_13270, partial [Bacteroidetes bacterium]|nr:hypothetical protein [Bacteroidota bacterium]
MNKTEKLQKRFKTISIVLFAASLTQKCYCTTTGCADSIMVVLLGWAGIFSGGAALSWLANPLLIMSWITQKKKLKVSMFLSMLAFLFTLSFLMFNEVPDNEAGGKHPITHLKVGYWIWVSAAFIMMIGNYTLQYMENVKQYKQRMANGEDQNR